MFGGYKLENMASDETDKWRYIDYAFTLLGRIYIIVIIISVITTVVMIILNKNKKTHKCPCELAKLKAQREKEFATETIKA